MDRKEDYPWTNEDSWAQAEERAEAESPSFSVCKPTNISRRKQLWMANKF